MKNTTLILSALFATAFSFAQLNVRNNAYVFVNDEIVFVENNVNLQESTTNFYLRNEAQLIQGNQTVANSGAGSLSQLESVKNGFYGYNAWASPVGQNYNPQDVIFSNNGNAANGFTTFGNVDFVSDTYTPNATPAQTEIADYWLWGYVAGALYADWVQLQDPSVKLNEGYGFIMKGASLAAGNTAKDFRGLPNSDDITINILANVYTLVGNPYPSALDARDFIHDAANVPNLRGGNLFYYYAPDMGSHNLVDYQFAYASYTINAAGTVETKPDPALQNADITGDSPTPAGSTVTNTAERYIPISQGFFVEGDANGTLIFRNTHRDYVKRSDATSTTGYKTSNKASKNSVNSNNAESLITYNTNGYSIMPADHKRFRLNATFVTNQVNRQLVHTFNDALTSGEDYGYETFMSPILDTDAYFYNSDRILNGIADAYDIDMRIPFVVKLATNQVINFGLVDIQNFEADQPIYLHDLQTNEYFDISNNDHQISLPAGDYSNRFEITFKNNSQVLSVTEEAIGSFNVFQNNNTQSLTLLNPNSLDVSKVSVFDVTGKQVFASIDMKSNSKFEVSTKNLSDAVYIVKIDFLDGATTSKKVVVSNKR